MSFEGMDVDQLTALAKQIDSAAQALYNLVTNLTGTMGGLTLLWHGPVAATFEQDWESKNRPALLAAHNILTNLHTHLVNNINQQKSASAAGTGWTATSSSPAKGSWTAERVVGDFENTLTGAGLVGFPVSALAGTSKFLGVSDVVLREVGYIDVPISAYHELKDGVRFDEDLISGHYVDAANDMADELSEGLKGVSAFVPWPYSLAVYGAGADVKLLDEVANLDWKDTPNPFSGDNWKTIYAPELSSMKTKAYWEQAGKTLWGAL